MPLTDEARARRVARKDWDRAIGQALTGPRVDARALVDRLSGRRPPAPVAWLTAWSSAWLASLPCTAIRPARHAPFLLEADWYGTRVLLAACRIDGPAGVAAMVGMVLRIMVDDWSVRERQAGARVVCLGWDGRRGLRSPEPTVQWLGPADTGAEVGNGRQG
jgi:hypothetical protein